MNPSIATARERLDRDGFVSFPDPVVPADELADVRSLVDEVIRRAPEHPEHVHDLGKGSVGTILEIVRATELVPDLRETAAFRRCRALAAELLDVPVAPFYDHVIDKAPGNRASTAWHQDIAYSEISQPPPTAHMWLPLQEATVENGCMMFLPGSHRQRVEHRKRGGDPTADALEALDVDKSRAVACPIAAGGLTIHHPATMHHTGPNTTGAPRTAWIMHFREEGTWGLRAWVPGPVRRALHRLRGR